MLMKCVVGGESWESLGLQGNQSWVFIGKIDVEAETPILWLPDMKSWFTWKDPNVESDWRWEEKGTTGWGGWMASLTQWTWIWVNSRSWWWTGRPGVLQSLGLQRVGLNWVIELNWITPSTPNKKQVCIATRWNVPVKVCIQIMIRILPKHECETSLILNF